MINPGDQSYFRYCFEQNRPYFGWMLRALQGSPPRHFHMQRLVQEEGRTRGKVPLQILEIGSWAGGSAITWADALKKCPAGSGRVVCIDAWKPYFDAVNGEAFRHVVYQEMAEALERNEIFPLFLHNIRAAGHEDIVIPIRGASADVLPLLHPGTFDIVFVDGDHLYEGVRKDLCAVMSLVRDGGILCGDDLEMQLHQLDESRLRQQIDHDFVREPARYHPGVTLAVGELFGEVSCWEGFWAMRRRGEGWEPVRLPELSQEDPAIPAHIVGLRATDYLHAAEYYLEQAQPGHYLGLAERACDYPPGDLAAFSTLALRVAGQFRANNFPDEAIKLLEQTLQQAPDDFSARYQLGLLQLEVGRFHESIECLERAAQAQPEDPALLNKLGEAYFWAGYVDRAENAFIRANTLAPDDAEIRNNLAVLHWNRGDAEQAIAHAAHAVGAEPNNTNALLNLAKMLDAVGRTPQAIVALERFLASGSDPAVSEELARLRHYAPSRR